MAFLFRIPVLTCLLITSLVCLGYAQAEPRGDTEQSIRVLVAYHSLTGNTEKMAKAVVEGAQSVPATIVELQRVEEVTGKQLLASDAVVVGSPVYWANMAGEVKTFFDNWQLEFGVFPGFKMRNRVGAAFATGNQISSGKELTMLTILAAMLGNQMIVVSESGAASGRSGAFGASATTGGDSPGIDEMDLVGAPALGKRVAEVTWMVKNGKADDPSVSQP